MSRYLVAHNSNDNLSDDDSSMFHAKIRIEDIAEQKAVQDSKNKAGEFAKEKLLKEAEGISLEEEIYEEVYEDFSSLLDSIESFADENNIHDLYQELLERICSVFECMFKLVVNEQKEKGWLFSLLRKLLNKRLSWEDRLDLEIAELQKKLESNDLSAEERSEIMKRLKVLQEIKLYKVTAIGLIIGILANFIGFNKAIARSAEIIREIRAKAQEAYERNFGKEKEVENHTTEDKIKEETFKRKCEENALVESIFRKLADEPIPLALIPDVMKSVADLSKHIDYLDYMALSNPSKVKQPATENEQANTISKQKKTEEQKVDDASVNNYASSPNQVHNSEAPTHNSEKCIGNFKRAIRKKAFNDQQHNVNKNNSQPNTSINDVIAQQVDNPRTMQCMGA